MSLDGRLVLLPLQPQLVAELLLGLLDVPDGQFPLLGLVGAKNGLNTASPAGSAHPEQLNQAPGPQISHPAVSGAAQTPRDGGKEKIQHSSTLRAAQAPAEVVSKP